jgi:hypothetical protein
MAHLSKLALAKVQKPVGVDPATHRRKRVLAALAEQRAVLAAHQAGKDYEQAVKRWRTAISGEREQYDSVKRIKPWFFQLNGEWYLQCKLGSRVVQLDEQSNAIKCGSIESVANAIDGVEAAVSAGELDSQLAKAGERKPRAAKSNKENKALSKNSSGT